MINLISKFETLYIKGHNGMSGSFIFRSFKKKGYGNHELNGSILITDKIANLIQYKGNIIRDYKKTYGTYRKQIDSSRFYSLGWYPRIKLEDGLQTTIDIFNNEIKKQNMRL